jgi:hypothetical protein
MGALSLEVEWLDVELTTHLHIMLRYRMVELDLLSPICLQAMLHN